MKSTTLIDTAISLLAESEAHGRVAEAILTLRAAYGHAEADLEAVEKLTSQLSVAQRRLGSIGPMKVTWIQRQMLRHALGLDAATTAYRNRYTVGTVAAEDAWSELCSRGLAVYSGGRATFSVTRSGFGHAAEPGETFDTGVFDGTEGDR